MYILNFECMLNSCSCVKKYSYVHVFALSFSNSLFKFNNKKTDNDVSYSQIKPILLSLCSQSPQLFPSLQEVNFSECVFRQVLFALNQTLLRLEELRNGRPSPFYGTEDLVRHYNCRNLSSASFGNTEMVSSNELFCVLYVINSL